MSLQSYSMRKIGDSYILSTKNKEGTKFGAIEMVNHSTPSGNSRHIPAFELNPIFDTEKEAIEKLEEIIEFENKHFDKLFKKEQHNEQR